MTLLSEIGKGSYARVVKVRPDGENAIEKALKIQKPACAWEWYISKEVQHRLKDSEKVNNILFYALIFCVYFSFFFMIIFLFKVSYFINMDQMYIFKNGSIISMEFATHGTLLSVIVAYKTAMVSPKRLNGFYFFEL